MPLRSTLALVSGSVKNLQEKHKLSRHTKNAKDTASLVSAAYLKQTYLRTYVACLSQTILRHGAR